ncbi:MAG: Mrp/NBP35 family ATP-binding protein [Clostridia bacterium]|nr:Mrp/NBP35 family ATP-binding protein [Clostridia bacterium]
MSECNHDCSSCSSNCGERTTQQTDFSVKLNQLSSVKKTIAVVSGKGGVGKSMVTSLLAVMSDRAGFKTGVLDADITGPSIPRAFGLKERAMGNEHGIYPVETKTGIEVMSINLLLENDTDPVVWRGPVIAGTVKQFWTDVIWGEIDNMFIDMPPGTGDVPLTVFQSLPIDGIVVVTTPQDMVGMIVEKAVNMAKLMNIPVFAIVENMSYYKCPDCGKEHRIFGDSHIEELAKKHGIETVCRLPINPELASAVDRGMVELVGEDGLKPIMDLIASK